MWNSLARRRRDEGSPLVEYSLIVSLLVAAAGTLAGTLGEHLVALAGG